MPSQPRYAALLPLNAAPDKHMEFIYALRCPTTKAVRYVGRTSGSLAARLITHMNHLTAVKSANPALLAWKQELHAAGLRPEIQRLAAVHRMDAASRERRFTRSFQQRGAALLNVRNLLLAPEMMGYDLWELNDIVDRHGLKPGDAGVAINLCGPSAIGFLSGAKRVSPRSAARLAQFLHSLPAEPITAPHHGLRNYLAFFLDEGIKAIWSRYARI